jgi:hypothetical protein
MSAFSRQLSHQNELGRRRFQIESQANSGPAQFRPLSDETAAPKGDRHDANIGTKGRGLSAIGLPPGLQERLTKDLEDHRFPRYGFNRNGKRLIVTDGTTDAVLDVVGDVHQLGQILAQRSGRTAHPS